MPCRMNHHRCAPNKRDITHIHTRTHPHTHRGQGAGEGAGGAGGEAGGDLGGGRHPHAAAEAEGDGAWVGGAVGWGKDACLPDGVHL